jgi:hypothetical protein
MFGITNVSVSRITTVTGIPEKEHGFSRALEAGHDWALALEVC